MPQSYQHGGVFLCVFSEFVQKLSGTFSVFSQCFAEREAAHEKKWCPGPENVASPFPHARTNQNTGQKQNQNNPGHR